MKDILMSIKPCYSQAILAGNKTVEFRRVFGDAAAQAGRVIIYESAPTMRIVGSFGIERIDQPLDGYMELTPIEQIWFNLPKYAKPGIDTDGLFAYMAGAKSPCAIYIKDVAKLEVPFSPKEVDPNFRPPQSYRWCPEWIQDSVKRRLTAQSLGPGVLEALLREMITGLADESKGKTYE